ncbi:MAG: hypothetical protein ABIK90_06210, partial [candidate division WOR-3 bacterium]
PDSLTRVIIFLILNSIFCGLDEWHLEKLGYNLGKIYILGFTLVPVYLFVRAYRVDKKYSYAIVWLIFAFIEEIISSSY